MIQKLYTFLVNHTFGEPEYGIATEAELIAKLRKIAMETAENKCRSLPPTLIDAFARGKFELFDQCADNPSIESAFIEWLNENYDTAQYCGPPLDMTVFWHAEHRLTSTIESLHKALNLALDEVDALRSEGFSDTDWAPGARAVLRDLFEDGIFVESREAEVHPAANTAETSVDAIVRRADAIMAEYAKAMRGDVGGEILSDLLADLMFWSDDRDCDFEGALIRARDYYAETLAEAEADDDDEEATETFASVYPSIVLETIASKVTPDLAEQRALCDRLEREWEYTKFLRYVLICTDDITAAIELCMRDWNDAIGRDIAAAGVRDYLRANSLTFDEEQIERSTAIRITTKLPGAAVKWGVSGENVLLEHYADGLRRISPRVFTEVLYQSCGAVLTIIIQTTPRP